MQKSRARDELQGYQQLPKSWDRVGLSNTNFTQDEKIDIWFVIQSVSGDHIFLQ
jgi:hypothetical protein